MFPYMRDILQKPLFIPAMFMLLLVALLAIGMVRTAQASSGASKSGERIVVIHDSNTGKRGFLTRASTVQAALEEAEIDFDANDLVEPGLGEELLASSYDINIYRARPVTIIDGAVRKKIMSAYRTPTQIVKHADMELRSEDITEISLPANGMVGGATIELIITRATEFNLVLYGEKTTAYTQGKTVGDMLKEKKITLSDNDYLSIEGNAPVTAGMTVELWREGKQTITEEEDIEFEIEQIQDVDRDAGFREVRAPGVLGKKSVTYEVEMKNGVEVSRHEIQSVVLTQPKTQVEVIGAKFNYTGGPLNEEQMTALGMCESGMNPTTNTGNSFYGAFQFMPATWRSVAPAPFNQQLPHQAPLDVQKQAVQNLLSRSSIYTQFPSCARQMQARGIL